jgi:hypothetical protein
MNMFANETLMLFQRIARGDDPAAARGLYRRIVRELYLRYQTVARVTNSIDMAAFVTGTLKQQRELRRFIREFISPDPETHLLADLRQFEAMEALRMDIEPTDSKRTAARRAAEELERAGTQMGDDYAADLSAPINGTDLDDIVIESPPYDSQNIK